MGSERIISTYVLLLRAAGRAAVPLSCRVRALLLRQPAVAECPLDQVIERRRLAVLGRRARIDQSFSAWSHEERLGSMPLMRALGERLAARMRALGQPWELGVFFWVPCLFFALVVAADVRMHGSLGDWEIFRSAARSVLHGHSPYPAADPTVLSHNDRFVYPPITAILVAPLAVLPHEAGRVLVLLLTLACVLVALRLLGVRDWR